MEHLATPDGRNAEPVMRELGRAQALDLMRGARLGRVIFTLGALPAVRPVNFALDRDDVVFRLSTGSRPAQAVEGAVVAFEADDFDPATRTGWSVVVTGFAATVTDPHEADRLAGIIPTPWAPGSRDAVFRIASAIVTGRRITRPEHDEGNAQP